VHARITKFLPERVFSRWSAPGEQGRRFCSSNCSRKRSVVLRVAGLAQAAERVVRVGEGIVGRGNKTPVARRGARPAGFESEIKKIYDFLPINVAFTSSSSISLHEKKRRPFPPRAARARGPFSLRELVYFETDEILPPLSLSGLCDEKTARDYHAKVRHAEARFDAYLQGRNYPFALGKTELLPLFRSILETIITNDLVLAGRATPRSSRNTEPARVHRQCSRRRCELHVALPQPQHDPVQGRKIRAPARRRVRPPPRAPGRDERAPRTQNPVRAPYRLLYKNLPDAIGAIREEFFVDTIASLGFTPQYLKTERGKKTPDYLIGETVFEIGGATKPPTNSKAPAPKSSSSSPTPHASTTTAARYT